MTHIEKRTLFFWIFGSILLFFYTFTQVDLSLTLTSLPFASKILLGFQYIGFFNRPLSSLIYILLLLLFASLYFFTLLRVKRDQISKKALLRIILSTSIILTFSYNAFSYDIFNYIFDAKIVTHYHENPYVHKALDYTGDPMLSFMRWTHRVYPYGPVWLALTVPVSYLGFGFFLPTFFLFKILSLSFYLIGVLFLYRLAKLVSREKALFITALFALNPLVLYEGLISSHLDIVMTSLMITAIYFLFQKKYVKSYVFLAFSIGIKFATGFLLPIFVFKKFIKGYFFEVGIFLLLLSAVAQTIRDTFQPWYVLTTIPLIGLTTLKRPLILNVIVVLGGLLYHLPPLRYGDWNKPVPEQLDVILIFFTAVFLGYILFEFWERIRMKKRSV